MGDVLSFGIQTSFDPTGVNAAAQSLQAVGKAAEDAAVQAQKIVPVLTRLADVAKPVTVPVSAPSVAPVVAALERVADAGRKAGAANTQSAKQTEDAYARATEKIQAAVLKLKEAEQAGKGGEGGGFLASVAAGVGLGAGIEAAHLLADAVKEIGAAFTETAARGFEFNREIETETVGLAATLRSVDPKKYLNFDEAKVAGSAALDVLRTKANDLGVDFKSLAQAYSANLRALVEGGVTDTAKQVDLVSTLLSAAASKGVTGVQALRDSIDILNGRAGNIVLAKELGLESDALKEATKNGQLYELIIGKIGGYKDAVGATASSLAGLQQQAKNLFDQLAGSLTEESFEAVKTGVADLVTALKDPDGQAAVASLASGLGEVTRAAVEFVRVGADIGEVLAAIAGAPFAPAAAITAATVEANKLGASYALGNRQLRDQISNATDLRSRLSATKEVNDAIRATEAQLRTVRAENRAVVEQQLYALNRTLDTLDATAGKQRPVVRNEEQRRAAIEKQLEAEKGLYDQQLESLAATQKQIAADEARIAKLNEALNARRPLSEQEKIATAETDKQFEKLRSMAGQLGLQIGPLETIAQIQADIATVAEARQPKLLEELETFAKLADKQAKIREEIGNQGTALDALNAKLKKVRDELPLDGTADTADARGGLNRTIATADAASANNLSVLAPLVAQAVLAQLIGAVASQGALPAPFSRDPTAEGDTLPQSVTPAYGPRSPLAEGDTLAPATEGLKSAAEGLRVALETGLAPVGNALNTAAVAVAGQVAPIVAGVGALGDGYTAAFGELAGTVAGQTDALGTLAGVNADLKRELAALQRRVDIIASS